MGFWDTLEKVFNGAEDFIIAAGNQYARQIDKMTDEEIEKRYSKPADKVRMDADMLQMKSEMLQTKKEKREMQAEIMRMKQEQRDEHKEEDKLGEYGECNDDFWE